jgi:hypothetical protein
MDSIKVPSTSTRWMRITQRYLNRADIRFAVQAAFAAYSVPAQSDKFYDLAGSLGFLSTTLVSLVSSPFYVHVAPQLRWDRRQEEEEYKDRELTNRCHPLLSLDSPMVDESHLLSQLYRVIILGSC